MTGVGCADSVGGTGGVVCHALLTEAPVEVDYGSSAGRNMESPSRGSLGTPRGAWLPPSPMSSLVGRDGEVTELVRLIETHRLVTVVGPPGVGKSRIAIQAARERADSAGERVLWIDFASITEPDRAVSELSDLLGLAIHLDEAATAGHYIVMLDNADRWLEECAFLVDDAQSVCADLRVVTTSREPLDMVGELVWRVDPLHVPAAAPDESPRSDLGPAVELFRQRAMAVRPEFRIDDNTQPLVADICRRLDGLPLAIELAAIRMRVLSAAQIAAGIDDRFRLLRGSHRNTALRHRSMEAAIDASHATLGDEERCLLRRLAVFPAGCTLDTAQDVCGIPGSGQLDVLDALEQLVAKSLVVADTDVSEARYRMLHTIRHFANDRLLEAGEADDVLARLTTWCIELAERASEELEGPNEVAWVTRLEVEYPNIVATLTRLTMAGQDEDAVRLGVALTPFWPRSRMAEGKATLYQLADASREVTPRLRAKLLSGLGSLAIHEGRFSAAVAPLDEALVIARAEGDHRTAGRTLLRLAIVAETLRGPGACLPLAEESLAIARDLGDTWCASATLAIVARANHRAGDQVAAMSMALDSVAVARGAGLVSGLSRSLLVLGFLAADTGDGTAAAAAFAEALELNELLGSRDQAALILTNQADLALTQGRIDDATELLDQATVAAQQSGDPWTIMQPLLTLGRLAEWQGDPAKACARFSDVLLVGETVGFASVEALEGLGRVIARYGDDPAIAERLLRDTLAAASSVGSKSVTAAALHALGELSRASGQPDSAASFHRRALVLRHELVDQRGLAQSLDALGGVSTDTGRYDRAVRLFGAAERALRASGGFRVPADRERRDTDLARARSSLGDRFDTEWSRGEAMPGDDAVAATLGRRPSWRPSTGWASLTPAEHDVVGLVVEGYTNREVGERLVISRRTVQTHLAHVFAKLGLRSRKELAAKYRQASEDASAGPPEPTLKAVDI